MPTNQPKMQANQPAHSVIERLLRHNWRVVGSLFGWLIVTGVYRLALAMA